MATPARIHVHAARAAVLAPVVVVLSLHQEVPPLRSEPSVVVVVLDSVRADHTSLCGYDRPTTPVLAALAREGAWTCEARAPGSWTLPSHASYFTGVSAARTGARFDAGEGGDRSVLASVGLRPLRDDVPTLAEHYAAEGWGTLLVSGNPVVGTATGLGRGFADVRTAVGFGALNGSALVRALDDALTTQPPADGLFLTVNISDAHHPWRRVPVGVSWLDPAPGFSPFAGLPGPSPWQRFVTGALTPGEATAMVGVASVAYDWAVARADRTLGRVLRALEAHGYPAARRRLVVVSDHGEFLGEHGLLDHGRYLFEENQRVPLVYVPEGGAPIPTLPEPMNALHTFHLARDGALPDAPEPVFASSYPDSFWSEHSNGRVGGVTTAAAWLGDRKLVWTDGAWSAFDLASDRAEASPLAAASVPGWLADEVEDFLRDAVPARDGFALDADVTEALRALGYVR